MTAENSNKPESRLKPAKMLVCKLPEDGTDLRLMRSLLEEKNITRVSSIACNATINMQTTKTRAGKLPEPLLGRVMTIIVDEDQVDEIFEFVLEKAQIGQQGRGALFQVSLVGATPYTLPEDVPRETYDN